MMYYLDTNICSYYISQRFPQVTAKFEMQEPNTLFVSSIVCAELAAGVENGSATRYDDNKLKIGEFLKRIQIRAWDEKAIWLYGQHKTRLWRAGTRISEIDLLLGCQALAENAVFVTNNTREFERIEGLKLENWVL